MSYQTAKANQELKAIYREYVSGYKEACAASRDRFMAKLSPGAKIPDHGKIYDQEGKAEFTAKCSGLRAKAHEVTSGMLKDLRVKATEAPSTEAVNAITVLGMRKKITESEVSDLLGQYGSNPLCWKSIVDIAEAHDIHSFGEHPVDASIHKLEDIDAKIERNLTTMNAEQGRATEGWIAMAGIDIDCALPVD